MDKTDFITRLKNADPSGLKVLLGLDGFVDEVIHIVDTRYDSEHYDRLGYLTEFGQKIKDSAGLSRNFEFVPIQRKLGGNGPNMANSMIECGCDLTYVGALGYPDIHPVFENIVKKAHPVSFSDPGYTEAIEFFDGKLICSKLESLNGVNAEALDRIVGAEKLAGWLDQSDFIGFENWTLVVHTTEVWEYILDKVIPLTKHQERDRFLFFDLCDPEKREKKDIEHALKTIERFSGHFKVILGLNLKECRELAELFGKEHADEMDVKDAVHFVKSHLGIDLLVVHQPKCVHTESADGECEYIEGPYDEHPKLTTGAGDNFNAGFALGKALGFSTKESLVLGVCNSGYYVRNCKSPNFSELTEFIENWIL